MKLICSKKGVIFDFDGTLVDTSKVWNIIDKQFFERRGIDYNFEEYWPLIQGKSLKDICCIFKDLYQLNESVEQILAEYNQLIQLTFKNKLKLRDGAQQFIELLISKHIKVGIASSCSKKNILDVISNYPIIQQNIKAIVTSEEINMNKPCVQIYQICGELMGICNIKDDIVIFEDSYNGILGAKQTEALLIGISSFEKSKFIERQNMCNLWIENYQNLTE
eukprot:EST49355.1 Haloacid dehalogenase-like hydrolase family protein [Spironucleus salmonicida]